MNGKRLLAVIGEVVLGTLTVAIPLAAKSICANQTPRFHGRKAGLSPWKWKAYPICTEVTILGKPEEVIIRCARDNQVDLTAMATHGRGGLQNPLFGSVAQHVLRESGLPLLLIRPKDG
jgi:hypothetical protein